MQTCKSTQQRKFSGVITGAILAGSLFALPATSHAATTLYKAVSYGAEVNIGSAVKLGKVAVAQLPGCDTQPVGEFTATAASVNKNGLINTGLVDSIASSTATSATASSDVFGVNLLNGLIASTEIKAVSTSSVNSNGTFQASTNGSIFGSLVVAGIHIPANIAPNTVIDLPLVGSVTLNEQIPTVTADMQSLTVNMIHVRVTLGSNTGTEIIVSSATSYIKKRSGPAFVSGYAYAPQLVVGPVTSGPLVYELIPCSGTSGAVETDSVAGTSIPGVVTTGTVTVTGMGNINKGETISQATTSIAGINLLSGLLSATAITGNATATTTDGVNFDFNGGSTFVGINVAGHPEITTNIAPNTKIVIANLGVLYLNRVETSANKVKVVPIQLNINATNSLGLPIGAVLTLGAAEALLHSAAIP